MKIIESEKQIFGSCQRTKKILNHEVDGDTNRNCYSGNSLQEPGK